MLAGEIVKWPREGWTACAGCRRIVLWASTVALDYPGGGYVIACTLCYQADPPSTWRGLSVYWDGERWITYPDEEDVFIAAK